MCVMGEITTNSATALCSFLSGIVIEDVCVRCKSCKDFMFRFRIFLVIH